MEDLPETVPTPEEEDESAWPAMRIAPVDRLISLAIVVTTLLAYWRVPGFGFVNYDDPAYVVNNFHLRDGSLLRTLKWIFLSFDPDNWFPVTRFSLLLDYKLFGLRAGFYHTESLLLHCVAALLLFGFLRQATRVRWPCAFVAMVFALHPLHVESVAWIAERKDVLCAVFWFAALWAWTGYTQRPGARRYWSALALFSAGLMSKPMIVTLPFLLLLLDVWPLQRAWSRKLLVEKLPFAVASVAVMAITIVAQSTSGAIQTVNKFPLLLRGENALITVAVYIAETLWPARLWIPHVYPESLPGWQVAAVAAGIAAVSAITLRQVRIRPYLAVGWLWLLITLVPVIGLLQVGQQGHADRYMYVPMVGLAIMVAWGIADLGERRPGLRPWASGVAVAACLAMASRASRQTPYWKDSGALFRHAIAMDNRNFMAWVFLGRSLEEDSANMLEAIACFRNGLQIHPEDEGMHSELGSALCRANRIEECIAEYRTVIRINPAGSGAHSDLGEQLAKAGRQGEAIEEFEAALRLDPESVAALNDLGALLWKTPGRSSEGLRHLQKAVAINPDHALAQFNLGQALMNAPNGLEESILHFNEALRTKPGMAAAHRGIAAVLIRAGMTPEAMLHLQAAQRTEPNEEVRRLLEQMATSGK